MTRRRRDDGRSWIGTSGWHYSHWAGRFYPKDLPSKAYLTHYAGEFQSVEINSSLYRLPSEETLRDWTAHSPADFLFACKASQYITHRKKLKDPSQTLPAFLDRVAVLGNKLGPVLFQLPPRWRPNLARLEGFLEVLPRTERFTFEFRDPRWNEPAVMRLLEDFGCAYCCFDLGGAVSPIRVTADFVYIRLHGPGAPYQGSYSDASLAGWAARIAAWQADGLDVFCYFDNDERAYAPRNAKSLIKALSGLRADAARAHRRRPGRR